MAKLRNLPGPVVRGRAGFHADETRWLFPEEGQHLATPQLTPDNRLSRGIDGMDLENALRDIDTDRDNFIHRMAPVPRG